MTKSNIRIGVFDSEYRNANRYIIHAMNNAFGRLPQVASTQIVDFHTAHSVIASGLIDVLVVIGSAENVHWLLPRWRDAGVTTVFWATEDPYETKNNLRYMDKFDVVFTNDLACLPAYRPDARHLPLAASLDHHLFEVREDSQLHFDVLFIGTAWPNRVRELNYILDRLPSDVRLKIGLPGNPYIPQPVLRDPRLIYNWRCTATSFAKLANRSKITLTLGRHFSNDAGAISGSTPPPRVFELGLAGTAQVFITRSRETERYYRPGHDLITARSIEEAMPAIQGLLDDPARRRSLAVSMQERTRRDHTYERRAQEILDGALRVRPSPSSLPTSLAKRRRVLVVAHNREGRRPGGGVEVYIAAMMRVWQQTYDLYLLIPDVIGNRTILQLELPDGTSIQHETRSVFSNEYISSPDIEEILFNIIVRHGIELVHFNHLLGLPLTMPIIAKLAGAQTAFTFHDHYLICDNFNLLSHEGTFCEFDKKSESFCDVCLRITKGIEQGAQAVRRNTVARVIKSIDLMIFNTEYSRRLANTVYDISHENSVVIEMLMPQERYFSAETLEQPFREGKSTLRVKIPGNFTVQKGAHLLIHVLELLRNDDIVFDIIGRIDTEIENLLTISANPNVTCRGGYNQFEVAALLSDGDVSINYSIWPETYMISLSESWSAGLVPIVSNLGAPAERVTDGRDGFVIPNGDVGRIVEVLRLLAGDRALLKEMKANVRGKTIVRSRDHFAQLRKEFDRLLKPIAPRRQAVAPGERIIFDRAMYAERHTNNKWTDVATLWDENYNQRHLGEAHDVHETPRLPLSDIPMKYWHLPRVEREGYAGNEIEIIETGDAPDVLHRTTLKLRLSPAMTHPLVEAFARFAIDGARILVQLILNQETVVGGFNAECKIPPNASLKEVSIICVLDGVLVEYVNLLPPLESVFFEPGVLGAVHIEGCDRLEAPNVRDGVLHVRGWAFDPISGGVPESCKLHLTDEMGQTLASLMRRVPDPTIGDVEPLLTWSGLEWSCPLAELNAAFGHSVRDVTASVIQLCGERTLTSGVRIVMRDLDLHGTKAEREMGREAIDRLVESLQTLDPGLDELDVLNQARTLVDAIDTRVLWSSALGASPILDETARRHLLSYYVQIGEDRDLVPRIDFDPTVYRNANPEIAGQRPLLLHFWQWGRCEGRVASHASAPVTSRDTAIIRRYLDTALYKLQAFKDAPFSGDLAQHYVSFGESNDLKPTSTFDPAYYRMSNPDVGASGGCLFAHYISFGREEGRRPSRSASIASRHANKRVRVAHAFDTDYYLSQIPYIRNTGIDPICHFFEYGALAGLSPNRDFEGDAAEAGRDSLAERYIAWSARTMGATT